ncbi:MAG TPA: aminotransferase class V-fold PLP-dependent enzyme [Chloroflexota bacterium]|nr:aminotransferase class V-fold PLP-dependent enzyme [Chloroflexota bacterium]
MTESLVGTQEFVGLDDLTHLCAGGEAPFLKSHLIALERFATDKSAGMAGRDRMFEVYHDTKQQLSWLVNRPVSDIALLGSASEGVNLVAQTIDWGEGDNVVVGDVEFPSMLYPWTSLATQGVELRLVKSRERLLDLDDFRAVVDERTRVVAVSQVSFLTGQRISLPAMANIAWERGARLLVDATHALGAVSVDANHCDYLVSSCYKWLLASHGVGIFVWNRSRVPEILPTNVGWHTVTHSGGWSNPTVLALRPDADRLEMGNPSFPSLYILRNALERLARVRAKDVERHVLELASDVRRRLVARNFEVTTPEAAASHAGNVCFKSASAGEITKRLADEGILVWGSEGRIRVSTHLYNSTADVDRLFASLDYAA